MNDNMPDIIWVTKDDDDIGAQVQGDLYAQYCKEGMVGQPTKYIRSEAATVRVKLLNWTAEAPIDQEAKPGDLYALGIGGHYCVKPDGELWWSIDPFTWQKFNDKTEAKSAAQIDHDDRVLALIQQHN